MTALFFPSKGGDEAWGIGEPNGGNAEQTRLAQGGKSRAFQDVFQYRLWTILAQYLSMTRPDLKPILVYLTSKCEKPTKGDFETFLSVTVKNPGWTTRQQRRDAELHDLPSTRV